MTLARLSGIPDLVLFLALGVLTGPFVLGWVQLSASGGLGELIVTGGAVFMLYEGGRAIDLSILRRIWPSVTLLATVGVALTSGVVALATHLFIGATWPVALLAGAAIASTDPATIVPLFMQVKVKRRIQQLVVSESAFNDATAAVLTIAFLALAQGQATGGAAIAGTFGRLILVGVVAGLVVGLVVQYLVAEFGRTPLWTRMEQNGVATLFAMAAAYATAQVLGGSGFMAVFLAGIVRGSGGRWGLRPRAEHEAKHEDFLAILGTAVRILIFGVLGANVDLPLLGRMGMAGLAVTAALLFIGRPVTVFACLLPDRLAKFHLKEMLFVSWVRETGVVPAALGTILLAERAPGAETVAALIFLAIMVTIVVQAPTTRPWARRLGVSEEDGA